MYRYYHCTQGTGNTGLESKRLGQHRIKKKKLAMERVYILKSDFISEERRRWNHYGNEKIVRVFKQDDRGMVHYVRQGKTCVWKLTMCNSQLGDDKRKGEHMKGRMNRQRECLLPWNSRHIYMANTQANQVYFSLSISHIRGSPTSHEKCDTSQFGTLRILSPVVLSTDDAILSKTKIIISGRKASCLQGPRET